MDDFPRLSGTAPPLPTAGTAPRRRLVEGGGGERGAVAHLRRWGCEFGSPLSPFEPQIIYL